MEANTINPTKPRLLLFGYHYDANVPRFLREHSREHIKCLEQSFEVAVVAGDCDYDHACATHRPELSAFEIGLQIRRARRPVIANLHAHPDIPRVGLMNADAWGATRGAILSDAERLDLRAVFSICTTAGEHLPGLRDRLFYWPNFFDPEVFKDYGLKKVVPVVASGSQGGSYPWRAAVYARLASTYPTVVCPHHGYAAEAPPMQMLTGLRYAKLLNSAWFAPSCGTVAKELLRKHLEIPACRTGLVTEASPVLAHAGFVDMKNCVFATEHDVTDKLDLLFRDSERLERLLDAGQSLVMARHTIGNRNQVADWFGLFRRATGSQVIAQLNPFAPLTLAHREEPHLTLHVVSSGEHLLAVKRGNSLLRERKPAEAEAAFQIALGYFDTLDEAKLGLVMCSLLQGRREEALRQVVTLIKQNLSTHRDIDPDPAEWAVFIVCLLCNGQVRSARRRAGKYLHTSHPDLDLMRALLISASALGKSGSDGMKPRRRSRASLHLPLFDSDVDAERQLHRLLTLCGQLDLADKLTASADRAAKGRVQREAVTPTPTLTALPASQLHAVPAWRAYLPGSGLLRGLDNPLLGMSLMQRGNAWLQALASRARPAVPARRAAKRDV